VSQCVGFNIPLGKVILETSLSRQLIALVLTTKVTKQNTTYTLNTKQKQKKYPR